MVLTVNFLRSRADSVNHFMLLLNDLLPIVRGRLPPDPNVISSIERKKKLKMKFKQNEMVGMDYWKEIIKQRSIARNVPFCRTYRPVRLHPRHPDSR